MAVDGTYKMQLETTTGTESLELVLKTEGGSLNGELDGYFGPQSLADGKVEGNGFSFSSRIQSPVGEIQFELSGTVTGKNITGQVQLGSFRPSAFKGSRA